MALAQFKVIAEANTEQLVLVKKGFMWATTISSWKPEATFTCFAEITDLATSSVTRYDITKGTLTYEINKSHPSIGYYKFYYQDDEQIQQTVLKMIVDLDSKGYEVLHLVETVKRWNMPPFHTFNMFYDSNSDPYGPHLWKPVNPGIHREAFLDCTIKK